MFKWELERSHRCAQGEFGFTANLGLNIRIIAKAAELKIEHQWITKSWFLVFYFTGKLIYHKRLVVGLYNLCIHILHVQTSLKEGIVSSLQDGLLVAWLMLLAFIYLLVPAHITSKFQSLASSSYQGWVVMKTGLSQLVFLSLFILLPSLWQRWITNIVISSLHPSLSLKTLVSFLMN